MKVVAGIDLGSQACRVAVFMDGEVKPFEHRFSDGRLPFLVEQPAPSSNKSGLPVLPLGFVSLKQKAGAEERLVDRSGSRTVGSELSEIFRQVREDMQVGLPHAVEGVVIAVPGFFTDRARVVIREAAFDAGFPAVKLLDDGLAAVIGVATLPDDSCHLVYALGTGVFSVSVVRITGGKPNVLAKGGNKFLGGGDFDALLMGVILQKLGRKSDTSTLGDSIIRLRRDAERLKVGLSKRETEQCEIDLGSVFGEHGTATVSVTRAEFEDLIRPAVQNTIDQAHETVRDAGLFPHELSRTLLSGDSTKIPIIERLLITLFPAPLVRVDTLAIARGAARQGGQLEASEWRRREASVNDLGEQVVAITVAPAPVSAAPNGTWTAMFAPHIQDAERLWNSGNRTGAITAFRGVIDQSTSYLATLYQQVGEGLFHDGNYERAVLMMRAAVELNPKDKLALGTYHRAMNNRAQQQLRSGELKEARSMIQGALSLNRSCKGCLEVQARIEKALSDRSRIRRKR